MVTVIEKGQKRAGIVKRENRGMCQSVDSEAGRYLVPNVVSTKIIARACRRFQEVTEKTNSRIINCAILDSASWVLTRCRQLA